MKRLVGLLVALSIPFTAHAAARMVSRTGDWGVYSFKRDGKLVCYGLSVPKQSRPSDVDHGKNYFLIAPAANGGGNETEAVLGYTVQGRLAGACFSRREEVQDVRQGQYRLGRGGGAGT